MRTKSLVGIMMPLVGIILFLSLRLMDVQSKNLEMRSRLEALETNATFEQTVENSNTIPDSSHFQFTQKEEHIQKLAKQVEELHNQTSVQARVIAELSTEKQALASEVENLRDSGAKPASDTRIAGTIASGTNAPVTYRDTLDAWLCVSHLNQLCIAGRQWADVHGGYGPGSLVQLKDLVAPMIFICPATKPTSANASWMAGDPTYFDPNTIIYSLKSYAPFAARAAPGQGHRFLTCPIHKLWIDVHGGHSWPERYGTGPWIGPTE